MAHRVNCWEPQRIKPVVISSQAADVVKTRAAEGSETRSRAKAVMDPRVPDGSVESKI